MNLSWSALTQTQQKVVLGVAVLAVLQVAGLGYFMQKSPKDFSGSSREELSEIQLQISEAKDIILRKSMVEKELKNSIQSLKDLVPFAPAVFDRYAWAYEYISRRSALAGVMVDGLQEEMNTGFDAAGGEEALPYEVSILTRCGYSELVRFLWYLEEGNPLIVIKELTIDHSPDDPELHRVRIVVQWPPPFEIERVEN